MNRTLPWKSASTFASILKLAVGVSIKRSVRAVGWIISGKRLRGWKHLCAIAMEHDGYYKGWIRLVEPELFEKYSSQTPWRVSHTLVCILLEEEGDTLKAVETLENIRQAFGNEVRVWTTALTIEGCHCLKRDSTSETRSSFIQLLKSENPTWLFPVKAGDKVSTHLAKVLAAICDEGETSTVIYWDEDLNDTDTRHSPWIKPDWDKFLYLARDYLSGSCIIRGGHAVAELEAMEAFQLNSIGFSALMMRIVSALNGNPPQHIPLIMTHRSSSEGFIPINEWRELIMRCWPEPLRIGATINASHLNVLPPDPVIWPSVSIIIPTRDQAELLSVCLTSLKMTDYPGDLEIVIVDNGTNQPEALEVLAEAEQSSFAHVIRDDRAFNYAALNNRAASISRGEFICFLNNDIEIVENNWLKVMVAYAINPVIGAVGAQLLYPEGTIQHAGVIIGMGNAAGHIQKGVRPEDYTHSAWHRVTRSVSAVTAACMLVRRVHFQSVSGFDETNFAVAFNDVDLCLKLLGRKLRNIYVADVALIHHESKSRGSDYMPENVARFARELNMLKTRWNTEGYNDPYFSRLFSRASEKCHLEF